MSWLTVIWMVCVTASGMLAAMHLFLWFSDRSRRHLLWSALAGIGAAAVAAGELAIMKATSVVTVSHVLVWQNVAIALLIVSLTWFVFDWFGTGRRRLAAAITAVWVVAMIPNFFFPGNLVFSEVSFLEPHQTVWGEAYVVPGGAANGFRYLGDLASILFLVFVTDASVRLGRQRNRRRAWIVGGVIVFFILFAGIHTPLVDIGVFKTPYLVGFFFLAIVLVLTYELIRDVSRASRTADELRRVRNELEHLGRVNLLGELSAALAHELNQPLSAILANAQAGSRFLKADEPDLGEIADILEDIAADDKRAREIIQRLRSMLEKGEANLEPTDLNHAIEEAAALLGSELKTHAVGLETDLDEGMRKVMADRLGIQQVIINLVLNAEQAILTEERGTREILVRSRAGADAMIVEVADNGPGIDPADRARLFDPFYSTKAAGLGMGLSICRTIIENHGGEIRAENRKGGGAVFTISLPVEKGVTTG